MSVQAENLVIQTALDRCCLVQQQMEALKRLDQASRCVDLINQALPPVQQRMVAVWYVATSGTDIQEHNPQLGR